MVSNSFPKSSRLLARREFVLLQQKGHTFYGSSVIIQWRKSQLAVPRLGIIITTKFGKAHVRNRFKRLCREAFRLSPKPQLGIDFSIRPRKNFEYLTLSALMADLAKFFATFSQ